MMASMHAVFRALTGRILAAIIIGACGVALFAAWIGYGARAIGDVGPWLGLAGLIAWAAYWNPSVTITDEGLRIVNVWRTIGVPWRLVRSVETKWSLTLVTDTGKVTAWAIPAPRGTAPIPPVSVSPTGGPPVVHRYPARFAAATVRDRFERYQNAAGRSGAARDAPMPTVSTQWHTPLIAALGALVAVGVLVALV